MYVVNSSAIQVFDISQQVFRAINSVTVGFGVETVFASGEYLYLGANDAMYISDMVPQFSSGNVWPFFDIPNEEDRVGISPALGLRMGYRFK